MEIARAVRLASLGLSLAEATAERAVLGQFLNCTVKSRRIKRTAGLSHAPDPRTLDIRYEQFGFAKMK
jgi:hypothetical protein